MFSGREGEKEKCVFFASVESEKITKEGKGKTVCVHYSLVIS